MKPKDHDRIMVPFAQVSRNMIERIHEDWESWLEPDELMDQWVEIEDGDRTVDDVIGGIIAEHLIYTALSIADEYGYKWYLSDNDIFLEKKEPVSTPIDK